MCVERRVGKTRVRFDVFALMLGFHRCNDSGG